MKCFENLNMSWGAIAVLIILAGAVFEEIERATD